ncbi:MAG: alkaline phosphatase [Synergistaceae bacterium]|nr:alkaline phosphatase [Synergistaceae bacterium]
MLAASLAAAPVPSFAVSSEKAKLPNPQIKNIIVLIPDGMSVGGVTLTRWYNAYDSASGKIDTGKKLALDEMASGLMRTYWQADGIVGAITDSAPAATALATGNKTNDKFIAVTPAKTPVASILEAAKLKGKATGLVATSQIMHATPADYSSHYPDRSKEEIIAEQQVYNNIDVMFGGGWSRLSGREDKEDLIAVLRQKGYSYVTDKEGLKNLSGKVWGMFAALGMSYEMDRVENTPSEPSLADMTQAAVNILSKDPDGFFLMVEGSKIDWAAHANDPIALISDIDAFDQAVKTALEFAKKDNQTMVISITDHGNGGVTIGNRATTSSYSKDPVEKFIAPLKKAKLTGEGLEAKLNADRSNIKEVMSKYFGIDDLTPEEEAAIKAAKAGSVNYAVGPMISKRAFIGWTTGGHTGEDIVLYTYLPGDERITGVVDNTDIARICAGVWGIDLDSVTRRMFMEAKSAFEAKGAKATIDKSDTSNPKMVVVKGSNTLVIPENKNCVELNGKAQEIDSVTVNVSDTFYVSGKVVELIR